MDAALTGALVGALVGGLFSLIPGLHVNTLAALTLVTLPALPAAPVQVTGFLLAALGAATVVNVLPLVLLGVPEGADAPALLPGQRMARQGKAQEALSASATGSLIGLTIAAVVAVPLVEPLAHAHGTGLLAQLTPWVAAGALVFLVASDPAGPVRATLVVGLAGWLGVVALDLPVASPVGLPASVLLPVFLGLFGVPALRLAAHAGPPVAAPRGSAGGWRSGGPGDEGQDGEDEAEERTGVAGPVLGSSLGLLAGIFPGFTAGPATAVAATLRRVGDRALMATTAAVNTAAAVMASVALHAYGRTRTGVHAAQMALGAPLGGLDVLVGDLQALALGVAVGTVLLAALCRSAPVIGRAVPKVAAVLVPVWIAMVWAFTGWVGLLVTAAGWAVARVAAREGARRSLLMAALLVPTVVRAVGA